MVKAGFDPKVSFFFSNYLVSRKTHYIWNNFSSLFFNVVISVKQGSVLLPILPALYLFPIFHVFEKRFKNLKIPIILISFVDNGIFVLQEKLFEKSNSNYFCSYNVILSLLV